MFLADSAFALELLALVAGTWLLITHGQGFAKGVAYFTIVASILALLCTSFYSTKYWASGKYDHGSRMGGCPMMKKAMGDKGGMMQEKGMPAADHKNHH